MKSFVRILAGITLMMCLVGNTISGDFVIAASKNELTIVKKLEGGLVPDVTLPNLFQQKVKLSDFRGKLILIGFAFQKGPEITKNIEQFRQRIRSDFKQREVPFIRVSHVDLPFYMSEKKAIDRMRKGLNNDARLLRDSLVNFDMSIELDTMCNVREVDIPWFLIVGPEGQILRAMKGWYSEENLKLLKRELSAFFDIDTH